METALKTRKHSRKRQAILDKIARSNCHATADWLYQELRAEFSDISLDTVYRNLRLFKQDGTIVSIGTVNGQEHFEMKAHDHGHFICRVCHKVEDIDLDPEMQNYLRATKQMNSIQIDQVDLTLHGTCKACL